MPYTKKELQSVDFYQDFVNGLRNTYLEQIKDYANRPIPFGDENTDLYLFDSKGYEKSQSFDHNLIKNIKLRYPNMNEDINRINPA